MDRALSAPGKLFLAGEYAVLWGGTARVAAVGARGSAYVRRRADREVHLALEVGRLQGKATPAGVNWGKEVPEAFRFAARALDEALRTQGRESLGFELALSPSERSDGGSKLGLGGSARAAVLASEAARFVLEERADALKLALLAHAGAQGSGSGADVAACFAGGLIRYRRYDTRALADASREGRLGAALTLALPVEVARLPEPKLSLLYAFTGQSASTPLLVREIEARVRGERRARFAAHSEEWGHLLEEALLTGDMAAAAEACAELQVLLGSLGPVETEPMKRILALARSYRSTGKLSGAGGGDGCVLFCPDVEARAALAEALASRGFAARPLELEPGLRGERQADAKLRGWLNAG
jgi:phosphomevalonate kinase